MAFRPKPQRPKRPGQRIMKDICKTKKRMKCWRGNNPDYMKLWGAKKQECTKGADDTSSYSLQSGANQTLSKEFQRQKQRKRVDMAEQLHADAMARARAKFVDL